MPDAASVGTDRSEYARTAPAPVVPSFPSWAWTSVLVAVSVLAGLGWLLTGGDPLLWGLVPFSMLGNSLLMVPYDWYLPAYVQDHAALPGVILATLATVLVEFWNMDTLARILSFQGTAAFRGHRITLRLLGWYRRAPWWTLAVAGAAPIIPFYPCRILATLSRYPMWRYQTAVVVGRGARYAALAGIGAVVPIDPAWYLGAGVLMLAGFGWQAVRKWRI
ncbi:MAG: hypothetical protein AB7S39_01330 [Gemmatimonadales bacterium]